MSLIKDCLREKMELLTDSSVINESLKFIDSTHTEIERKFKQDMQNVKTNDQRASQPIYDAVGSNVIADVTTEEQFNLKEDQDNIV